MLKYLGPIITFLAALVIFYVGLFVGLQVSPAGGTTLWILSFVTAGAGFWWLIRMTNQSKANK